MRNPPTDLGKRVNLLKSKEKNEGQELLAAYQSAVRMSHGQSEARNLAWAAKASERKRILEAYLTEWGA